MSRSKHGCQIPMEGEILTHPWRGNTHPWRGKYPSLEGEYPYTPSPFNVIPAHPLSSPFLTGLQSHPFLFPEIINRKRCTAKSPPRSPASGDLFLGSTTGFRITTDAADAAAQTAPAAATGLLHRGSSKLQYTARAICIRDEKIESLFIFICNFVSLIV